MVHKKNYDFLPVIIYSFVGENKTKSGRKIGRLGQIVYIKTLIPSLIQELRTEDASPFRNHFQMPEKLWISLMNLFLSSHSSAAILWCWSKIMWRELKVWLVESEPWQVFDKRSHDPVLTSWHLISSVEIFDKNKGLVSKNKLCCCVHGEVKNENLDLSTELIWKSLR